MGSFWRRRGYRERVPSVNPMSGTPGRPAWSERISGASQVPVAGIVITVAAGLYWVTERDVMLAAAIASGLITLLLMRARHLGFLVISRNSLAEKSHELSVVNARLDIALNNISQGLCFFDGNQRLIVCNKRFVEMYDLPDGRVHPGMPLVEIVDLRFEAGSFPAMSKAEYLSWRTSVAVSHEPSDTIVELKNGKVFEIRHRPMSDGGWVATHEDITLRVRSEREARDAHKRLIEAFDVVPEGLVYFDKDDRYVLWNNRYSELYDNSSDLIVAGARFEDVLRAGLANGQYPEAAGREDAWLAERLERHDRIDSIHEQQLVNGRWVRVEERRTSSGERIGVRIDITDLKRREASFRLLFVNNPVPMWLYDLETLRFLAVNSSAIEHYGYSEQQFLSMSVEDLCAGNAGQPARRTVRSASEVDPEHLSRHKKADGAVIDVACYVRQMEHEGRAAALVAITDITANKLAEANLVHMAHHDALTSLPNRVLFHKKLEETLVQKRSAAILCIDLDDFKRINDTLGHSVGDLLLRAVADRLRDCVGTDDIVARLGGDEFAVIQRAISDPDQARDMAHRIVQRVSHGFQIGQHNLVLGASVGVAITPRDGETSERLLKNADMAMYRAKSAGRRTYCLFESDMEQELQERRTFETDLREALARQEFELRFQPTFSAASSKVGSVEALLRWRHPARGMISPAEFIPVAEETGIIVSLGEWVLNEACLAAANWPKHINVAVNLSPLQFKGNALPLAVVKALQASGLPAHRLELEITETVLLLENDHNVKILHQLRALGVSIAMDDFGIGYSSLSYLRSFPFDRIKIDRSFVNALPHNRDCLAIVRAVANLANDLNMRTTAEGVETVAQLDCVRNAAVSDVQGFLLSRPITALEVSRLFQMNLRSTA
jgi:diguanylate cyclase (GGDEF)-like protein/PAS domain S-box-containing protein